MDERFKVKNIRHFGEEQKKKAPNRSESDFPFLQQLHGHDMADDLNRGHPVSVTTPDLHTLKRKRSSSDEIIPMDEAPVPGPSRERARRDPTYYYEDGSCILLIEDTLFNVSRSSIHCIHSLDYASGSSQSLIPR